MIEATSIFGNKIKISKEKFKLRTSAYGIIKHEEKLLLIKPRSCNKWFFPGGGIEQGELIEDAIIREVKEETGINTEIEKFFAHKETFFYYDPSDEAFQNYSFYYFCKPTTFNISEDFIASGDKSENPEWVDISTLKKEDFQYPANEIFELL